MFFLLFVMAVSFTWAQERTVTGKVTSAEGPLPGVNILIRGTMHGTVTDVNGNYSIVVPGPDAVLEFSMVGFASQSIKVGDRTTLDVILNPELKSLDEVVVIGYGKQKKKELTSAIANVKSDEFNKGNVNSPAQLIQGKVAGLSITKPGGDPNAGYTIRLRGLSTIGANTQPLIVIDGVVGGSLDNVDPNDIKTIDVLKDGSAAAIYGTRGSSGVIIVTTKQGRKGTAVIDYDGYVSIESVGKYPNVMNADEWRALSKETGLGTDFGHNTDWFRETTRTAPTQVHNISLSGGNDLTTYRASFNYRNGQGIALNTGFDQINGRLNMTQKALKDKLTMNLIMGVTQRREQFGFREAFRYASIYNPTAPVKDNDPKYDIYDGYFQQVLFDYYNPVQILEEDKNDGKDKRMDIAMKGTYEILKGLSVDAFFSLQTGNFFRGQYYDKNSYWVGMDRNGLADRRLDESLSRLFESTVHWNRKFGQANMTLLGGYTYQDFFNEGFHARGGNFITDAFSYNNLNAALDFKNGKGTVESYKNSSKLIAFFGRVNLNIAENWFVMASARYEGSSRFGEDHKWGLFPAVGAGVDLSKFISSGIVDNLKLRASYGITGNQPAQSYLSLLRLRPSGNFYYNGTFIPGYAPASNANKDLRWETKAEIDAGVDFSLWHSKLYGSFDFYTRTTSNLLFQYQVPMPPNLYPYSWVNIGEIKNSGLELSLNWNAVKSKDFTYTMTLTPTYYIANTLVSLSGTFNGSELKYGVRDLGGMGAPGQSDVPLVRAEEGKPIGQLWALVFKEIDENGNLIFEDINHDGTIDPKDRQVVGNGLPKAEIGFSNVFSYKNWDLNVFFRSVLGHDLNNTYRAFYEVPNMIGSYNLPRTAADMRNPKTGTLLNNSSGILSSYDIENASFLELDNISLGYNFTLSKKSGIRKVRVYVAGNRLFYLTGYKGVSPEPRYADGGNPLIPGIDRRNTWFRTRSVSFGLNLGF